MRMLQAMLFVLFFHASQPCQGAEVSLQGDWVGSVQMEEQWRLVMAHFEQEGATMKGTIGFPLEGRMGQPLGTVKVAIPHVQFELSEKTTSFVFDGQLQEGTLAGDVTEGDNKGTFGLIRTVQIQPESLGQFLGTYRFGPDRLIAISPPTSIFPWPGYIDLDTGRMGALFAVSETTFVSGPSFILPYPVEVRATFIIDQSGDVTSLVWRQDGRSQRTGRKIRLYEQEKVHFQNGEVSLAGTLSLPTSKGPFSAVVLVHGSGPGSHNDIHFMSLVNHFTRDGIAVLAYDKRGVGASTGDWHQAGLDELAGDALAGVGLLKGRSDIRSDAIGLWGISQGGWIAPLAATRSADIAFVIIVSGAGVTPEQQEVMRVEHEMSADGFSTNEIGEAVALHKLVFSFAKTGNEWETLKTAIARAVDKEWYAYVDAPPSKDHWTWSFLRLIADHDPIPVLKEVECPVLVLAGGLDRIVAPSANQPIIENALRDGGNPDYTIKVFPKANHIMFETSTGGRKEFLRMRKTVDGYFETMVDWILERTEPRR